MGNCAICLNELVTFSNCNLYDCDHIIPFACGGEDAVDNLQLLCQSCHRIKTDYDNRQMRYVKRENKLIREQQQQQQSTQGLEKALHHKFKPFQTSKIYENYRSHFLKPF